jgi:hypothetical protein
MPTKKKKTQLDRIEQGTNRPLKLITPLASQLDRIEHAINGNGREGLLDRAMRLETLMAESTANSLRNSSSIDKLMTATHELKDSVDAHHRSVHLNSLITKARFWVVMFATLVGFNLISRYIPGAVTLLFAWLGLPNVHIPLE